MDFSPDIVVTTPGESTVHMVVEVKLSDTVDRDAAAQQLKHYMLRVGSPAGILVTRNAVAIFRDTFRTDSAESIEHVATILTSDIPELQSFAAGVNKDPVAFEDAVQDWLVQLRYRFVQGYMRGVDSRVAEHVMPALVNGEIRAGVPRPRVQSALG
jgi:hypothetical protein